MKPKPLSVLKSLEEKYVAVMKKLQFGKLKSYSSFFWSQFIVCNGAIKVCSSKIRISNLLLPWIIHILYVCMYVCVYVCMYVCIYIVVVIV